MGIISTNKGQYTFKDIHFQNGIKKIDREISKKNLLDLKKILDQNKIDFGLIYGTLLGAIREKNFIAHDEDTDIFILKENENKVLELLFELRNEGFEVGRFTEKLLSIIRNGEYIDIYFFRKLKNQRECEGYVIESHFLENLVDYELFDTKFKIPYQTESLLVKLYGKDWKTPKENTPASNYGLYLRIKFFIKNNFSTIFKIISWIKKSIIRK